MKTFDKYLIKNKRKILKREYKNFLKSKREKLDESLLYFYICNDFLPENLIFFKKIYHKIISKTKSQNHLMNIKKENEFIFPDRSNEPLEIIKKKYGTFTALNFALDIERNNKEKIRKLIYLLEKEDIYLIYTYYINILKEQIDF